MTVGSNNAKAGPYSGNGLATEWPFNFRVLDASHLTVTLTDPDGNESVLDAEDYDVYGVGDASGSVTYPTVGDPITEDYLLTITRNMPFTQPTDIANAGGFYPATHEQVFDRLTMMVQQVKEESARSVKVAVSSDTNPDDLIASLVATAAEVADDAAAVAEDVTEVEALRDEVAAAAAAVAAAAASIVWRDVKFLTFSDSPYTVTSDDKGCLLSVNTASGAVVMNLPVIAGEVMPFNVGIKKSSTDGNAITVNRGGTDTIDGATSKVINVAASGATFIADTDPAPDQWTTADFGASAGNMTADIFSGTGAQVAFTLSVAPGSKNNTAVYISGVYQAKATYAVSGTTLTFSSAPPLGTGNVEVIIGTTLSIGIPSDGSVGTVKLGGDIGSDSKSFLQQATAALKRIALGLGSAAVAQILGTVSQSGGVPTGSIVERGSNGNGTFVKFADGTMICESPITGFGGMDVSSASGSVFNSASPVTWTFPAAFSVAPKVSAHVNASSSRWATTYSATTTTVILRQYAGATSGTSSDTQAVAIGRWF